MYNSCGKHLQYQCDDCFNLSSVPFWFSVFLVRIGNSAQHTGKKDEGEEGRKSSTPDRTGIQEVHNESQNKKRSKEGKKMKKKEICAVKN